MTYVISGLIVLLVGWVFASLIYCQNDDLGWDDIPSACWYEKLMIITTYSILIGFAIGILIGLVCAVEWMIFG